MARRRTRCPHCGTHFEVDADAGGQLACPSCGASLGRSSPSKSGDRLIGQTLGQFQIIEKVGSGGMGAVYKARQVTLDRFVALKVLPPDLARDKTFVARFQREARSAAAVKHPNIIDMIDVGEDRGHHYIAMELVEGEDLRQILKREGPLDADRAVALMRQVAAALVKAHAAGICHRDIKPANILVRPDGTAKVADFGLAKRPDTDVSVTQTGQTLGTPLYMPPEAARGQPHDARSDLYSLGATFYRALAGRPPFDGKTSAELVAKHLEAPVPPLQALAPDAPPSLCRVIHRLMRKNPAERYESAQKVIEALDRVEARVAQPPSAVSASPEAATRTQLGAQRGAAVPHRSAEEREATKRRKTRNITIAGGVGGLIVLALALIFTLGGKGRAPKPPQAKAPPPTPVRRPAPKPAPPTPKPKVAKPKPKPKPTDWQAAWKDITAKAQELARHERFGDAVKAIAAIQSRLTNPRLKERARKAIAEIHRRADAAYRELEEHVSELIDAKAYAEARKALEPVVTRYGIERLVQDAKLILAEIEKREQDARLLAQWRTIKARSDRLIQTGDLAGAERTLEQARGLELDGIAGLIARQVGAIHDARRAAARRLLDAYAKESDTVWALFKAKEYAKADQRLTELAARPEFKVLAARVAADAEAAKLLKEFWRIVEKKLAAKKGQFVAFGGAAGKVVAVKNGQVTIQAGSKLETRHIHKLTAKQALRYAALGSDPRSKLLEGVFRLAEREDLDKAAKALDAAADAPDAALFKRRCAALQGHPPRK